MNNFNELTALKYAVDNVLESWGDRPSSFAEYWLYVRFLATEVLNAPDIALRIVENRKRYSG